MISPQHPACEVRFAGCGVTAGHTITVVLILLQSCQRDTSRAPSEIYLNSKTQDLNLKPKTPKPYTLSPNTTAEGLSPNLSGPCTLHPTPYTLHPTPYT
jgi:hypothetical protein